MTFISYLLIGVVTGIIASGEPSIPLLAVTLILLIISLAIAG